MAAGALAAPRRSVGRTVTGHAPVAAHPASSEGTAGGYTRRQSKVQSVVVRVAAMHWSDQVGEAALGVRGHPVESYNDVYYPRKGDADGSFPVYENSSQQLLFREERSYPLVWVLSSSLGPDNLEEPATWYARSACTREQVAPLANVDYCVRPQPCRG